MNKSVLIGMTALALALGACGKKTPPADIPPAVDQSANPPGTATDDSVDLVELPAMQADLVAKAGSDTVYFATDESQLDQQAQATLAAQARWLIANGVPEGRLTTISWGKERPVAVGSSEEAWAQNRRAVTVVVK